MNNKNLITFTTQYYITDRYHPLPEYYIPPNLVRAPVPFLASYSSSKRYIALPMYEPLRKLFYACYKDRLHLMGISAFRSYPRQKELYENSIVKHGKEYTNTHIAYPGTSEHQTGFAIDVSCPALNYELEEEFENTPEGIWLKENAGKFGFTFSFTKESQEYTGYVNEPWHIKYEYKNATFYPVFDKKHC
ncbi:MAG: M15 family metallopeptidase [Lachnospiraceae bacterium]|nr:M15 family metallopeptidase [Lachnospiraceae bacterium]